MEKARKIKGKVKAAMFYPCAVLLVAAIILAVLMVFVVPRFKQVFDGLLNGAAMPAFTVFVLRISEAIKGHLLMAAIAVASVCAVCLLGLRTKWGRWSFDRFRLTVPVLGPVFRKAAISRFARTLGTLVGSGVPILQALTIVKETAGNVIIGGYNDGLPIQIPMIEIQEVGTGGGSIASFGEGGAIHVGPQSAGASPGPACYGLGGARPTVTDANLLLGRLSATNFLGGTMPLHVEAARQAFANEIGERLDLESVQVAEGVLRIAVASMANVVKRVTTERGLDARDFVLVAYGGAGPLHAALVAEELRIGRVIVPNAPGHFSAFGMLVADFRRDYVQTLFTLLDSAPFDDFDRIFASMEREGTKDIRAANGDDTKILSSRSMDMRYVGQEHAVTADIPTAMFESRDAAGIKAQFDAIHQIRYGYASHDEAVEIVSLRCSVSGLMPKPTLDTIAAGTPKAPVEALIERRPVYFSQSNGFVETPVYARGKLLAGNAMIGPCLIEEHATTTVVPPGAKMVVDRFGDLLIDTKSAAIGATPAAHKADAVASAK